MQDVHSASPSFLEDGRKGLNIALLVARVWSISLEVFLHGNLGLRYPGGLGLAVLLFVPFFSCFWPGYDVEPLLVFLLAYFLMCVVQRFTTLQNRRKKRPQQHSFYNGFPGICELFPRLSEQTAKQFVEPLIVATGGLFCLDWNQPFGWYLIGGAVALGFSASVSRVFRQQQVLDLNDVMIEQQQLAERFRR